MHGLMNRSIERFVRDTYGRDVWGAVMRRAGLDYVEFEAMLTYDDHVTRDVLHALGAVLARTEQDILEDIGTFLVSHPNLEALRRLLRFGGPTFTEFLHSLDDLPARARLAVSDLILPEIELRDHGGGRFCVWCRGPVAGFGHVLVGLLRALADDYGALAWLEHKGRQNDSEIVEIQLLTVEHASGRRFDLGLGAL
ncbi:heme NO-binding domain-containing protein [Roseovarius dicentrarchi]|uniref:heme NO-binding domain-containing protein n=1 Tax=Roseovarius dicentrarchi TaxID=2250573 RepID=UPI000DEA568F|nr:heme NO-binding domain-containing protein [Roseovarius dicentrarchi]